ncbi:MAG: hypothetical protein WKF58_15865 [Ilumatobacteraceae bacterium]
MTNVSVGARLSTLRELSGDEVPGSREGGRDRSERDVQHRARKGAIKTDELTRIAQGAVASRRLRFSTSCRSPLASRCRASARFGEDAGVGSALERLGVLAELHEVLSHDGLAAAPRLDDVPDVDIQKWKESASGSRGGPRTASKSRRSATSGSLLSLTPSKSSFASTS